MIIANTFDDVLIKPKFSAINSRKDVDLSTNIGGLKLKFPVISANMDTVTNHQVANILYQYGGIGCLHRFNSIEKNLKAFLAIKKSGSDAIISMGLGDLEYKRAVTLIESGASVVCIDVAHGAQQSVVMQYNKLCQEYPNIGIIVGNFATGDSVKQFKDACVKEPMGFKVGIGAGAACLTRVQTGCGIPQLYALQDVIVKNPTTNIISDGGKKHAGDIAKALATGAKAVMLGSMLAAVKEGPGEIISEKYKQYRGSASQESYIDQGKDATWRTYEGDSFLLPYKGPLKDVLQNIEGGLRSALTYTGSLNLAEFTQNVEFIQVSPSTIKENSAHGKTNM